MLKTCLAVLGLGFAPLAGLAAAPPPNVLVVADVLNDTPETLRPQPGKPIHYIIIGELEQNLGSSIAGEPRAERAAVESEVVKVLASQGYLLTQPGGPVPKIALLITWGSAVLDITEVPYKPPPPKANFGGVPDRTALAPQEPPETMAMAENWREIASLVGADKVKDTIDPNALAEIKAAAAMKRAYIFVGAFDVGTMLQKKEKKMLWRTRMSIPSTHHSLPESLGLLLTSGAPYFGREASAPVFIGEADRRKANVEVGTPYVVPDPAKKKN